MISPKAILGVIIVAILIGVVYVSFEKNFGSAKSNSSQTSSSQELSKNPPVEQSTVISLPSPEPTLTPIDGSTDLLNEASNLQMRDYSTLFEDLKDKAQE